MKWIPKRIVFWLTQRTIIKFSCAFAIIVLLGTLIFTQIHSKQTGSSWSLPLSGLVIALDPGHGGKDGGAMSRAGLIEKDVNLKIALYLRDFLQESGAYVMMTRETDTDLADVGSKRRKTQDLHRRVEFVKEHEAQLLLSIHLNAIPSARWSGAQSFYDSRSHKDSQAMATFIQNELIHNLENTDRKAKNISSVYLLKSVEIPSVLIEAGFLSNPHEAELLSTEKYQKKVAASIYRGVLRYSSGEKLSSE